jgi:hypothetical protein
MVAAEDNGGKDPPAPVFVACSHLRGQHYCVEYAWTTTEYDGLLLLSMHGIRLCSPFIETVYVQDTYRASSETRNDCSTSHCMIGDSSAPASMIRKDQYISNAKGNKNTGKNDNSLVQKLDTSIVVVGNF